MDKKDFGHSKQCLTSIFFVLLVGVFGAMRALCSITPVPELKLYPNQNAIMMGEYFKPELLHRANPEGESGPLVDQDLEEELQRRYEQEIAYTDAEQTFLYLNYNFLEEQTIQDQELFKEYQEKQKKFGEFMVRRISEEKLDNYLKSNPDLESVYIAKKKYTNVRKNTDSGWRFKGNYRISGNFLEFEARKNQWTWQIFNRLGNPEWILKLQNKLTKKLSLDTYYRTKEERFTVVASTILDGNIKVYWTNDLYLTPATESESGDALNDSRSIVGMSFSY
ncbi:MAG: hypothetical protein AB8E15_10855 [Bdellovibrionales bacterium]